MIGAKAKADAPAMAKPAESPIVDRDLIRELAKLLDETGLTEIEIEQDGLRVRVARGAAPPRRALRRAPRAAARAAAGEPTPPRSIRPSIPGVVTSPMVGTAYRGAEPGAKPFVEVGSKVEGRRHAADHRGDEDHEPDPGAARRHRDRRSCSRTASRSNSASRW